MNLSSGVVNQATMPLKVAGYAVHLARALRVRSWLGSEVPATAAPRPVYPQQPTFWTRSAKTGYDPKPKLVSFDARARLVRQARLAERRGYALPQIRIHVGHHAVHR